MNEDRNRYYGIRIGDTVTQKAFGNYSQTGIVISCGMDNNQVIVETTYGRITHFVAEWFDIYVKIEDKLKSLYK